MKSPQERAAKAAYMREYMRKNPEARRKQAVLARQWYERNRELTLQRVREWNEQHPGVVIARAKEFKKTAKGKVTTNRYQRKRNQWRRDAVGSASKEQLAARSAFYGHRCYLCGAPSQMMDHVIPLAVRPIAWPANRRPICNRCNGRKADHSLHEYRSRDHRC